jgi:2'-5' RNA ligase
VGNHKEDLLRVFCAIWLPDDVREKVAKHIRTLQEEFSGSGITWENPEKLHLTLKFLGEISHERVAALSKATARAVERVPPFEITVDAAGSFQKRSRPFVLWLGINDESGQLSKLHSALEAECNREGFEREVRPYKAHLTIARIRRAEKALDLARRHESLGFEPASFNVSGVSVVSSELGPRGSRYTVLSSHDLKTP